MDGKELAERRRALGLTQAQLARGLGVHRQTLSQWERGVDPLPHWLDPALWAIEQGWQQTEG